MILEFIAMIFPGIIAGSKKRGGGGYTAKAVHFDGATWLINSSLTFSDGPYLNYCVWYLIPSSAPNHGQVFWVQDPDGVDGAEMFLHGGPDYPNNFELANQYVTDNTDTNYLNVGNNAQPSPITTDVWHSILWASDTSSSPQKYAFYIDDVLQTLFNSHINGPAFTTGLNGLPLWVGYDDSGNHVYADVSNFWLGSQSLLDGSGAAISTAHRRLFIDGSGKPVDPAVAVAALGTPSILLSGDHTTFPVNQGNGGAFAVTGTLTDAATHP